MSENKFVISTYLPAEAAALIIVCAPTNLIWTVQCGGIACRHPEAEGWIFPLVRESWDLDHYRKCVEDFNDCKWGCRGGMGMGMVGKGGGAEDITDPKKYRLKYAEAIDNFLIDFPKGTLPSTELRFDYERIEEVMEGWWPILIRFYCYFSEKYSSTFKGYLHLDNCD